MCRLETIPFKRIIFPFRKFILFRISFFSIQTWICSNWAFNFSIFYHFAKSMELQEMTTPLIWREWIFSFRFTVLFLLSLPDRNGATLNFKAAGRWTDNLADGYVFLFSSFSWNRVLIVSWTTVKNKNSNCKIMGSIWIITAIHMMT